MQKIQYINLCITQFAKKFRMPPRLACNYLRQYQGLAFLDQYYAAEHTLSLHDAISDLTQYCKSNGGTLE